MVDTDEGNGKDSRWWVFFIEKELRFGCDDTIRNDTIHMYSFNKGLLKTYIYINWIEWRLLERVKATSICVWHSTGRS